MARELKLTAGSETETLHSALITSKRLIEYTPLAPAISAVTVETGPDGAEQPRARYANVTDTAIVHYESLATARTSINVLQRAFDSARRRQQTKRGSVVYWNYRPDTAETLYRSEVLSGRVEFVDRLWRQVKITVNRRHFWEGSEAQLEIYNASASAVNVLTLYNYSRAADSKHNYVHIAAAQITGDVPTPARLEILNNYASGTRTVHTWVGHYLTEATVFDAILEAESGTITAGGASVALAAASAGNYANIGFTGTSEYAGWYMDISQARLIAAGGNWFRIFAIPIGSPTVADVYLRANLSIEGLTTLWDGAPVLVTGASSGVTPIDLGVVQLPGLMVGASAPYPIRLTLYTRNAVAGAGTIPIDYVHLMPATGWRKLHSLGYDQAQNVTLHDKPAEDLTYTAGWASGQINNYIPLGDPIMLVPNVVNGLYFQQMPTDSKLRSMQLKVFARPRRLIV